MTFIGRPPDRSDSLTALSLAAGVFVVYALGACRTIYVGDSGELVTAVAVLGIPHPSGYPLYVMLGKLWTLFVPFGSIAFRMSLFSALCAAAACGLLYRICRETRLPIAASVLSALLFAWCPSFWAEANVQRVYALGALFVAWTTLLAVRWHASADDEDAARAPRLFAGTLFVAGLGATNHTFMAVWAVAFLAFAAITHPALFRRARPLVAGGLAFAAGLLPYLYLPIRSRQDPVLDWGNPETLGALVNVVTRRDFWGRRFIESPADLVPIVADFAKGFRQEIGFAGLALVALGIAAALAVPAHRRLLLLPSLVVLGNLAAVALHGSRSDIFIWHRYDIPSYMMLAWVAAFGGAFLVTRLPRLGLLILLAPAWLLLQGFPAQDRSRYRIAEDFSRTLLATLPPGAHLAASDDNILFVLMYLHLVENLRPDVDLVLQGVSGNALPALRFDPDTDPLFFTDHPNWRQPELEVVASGLAFRISRRGGPLPQSPIPKLRLDGELDSRVPKDYLTQNLIGQFHYMLGNTLARSDWPRARQEFAEAAKAAPDNDVLFFNLGLIFAGDGLYDEAIAAFRRSIQINPRPVPGPQNARATDHAEAVEMEGRRVGALDGQLARDPQVAALPAGSPEWHRRLAALLRSNGETVAARGHELRAQEAVAGP
jgi:tetratricopeptide (TPR) repeat protein